jgi:hypothetical protein
LGNKHMRYGFSRAGGANSDKAEVRRLRRQEDASPKDALVRRFAAMFPIRSGSLPISDCLGLALGEPNATATDITWITRVVVIPYRWGLTIHQDDELQ